MTELARDAFRRFSDGCPHRLDIELIRRPANALNVEIGQPARRCRLKPPANWPAEAGMVT